MFNRDTRILVLMSVECSICLSKLKEPVSIPCGHIYCTKCLADHVNAPNNDETSESTCPTCRKPFNTVTPDLTYLPKKYHKYIIPSVRRVYFDTTRQVDFQNKLSLAEAKIKKLEKDQETLLRQCERHMDAASAHAEGERAGRAEIELLCLALNRRKEEHAIEKDEADQAFEMMKDERDELFRKYQDLKRRHSTLKQKQNECDTSRASLPASQRSIEMTMPCSIEAVTPAHTLHNVPSVSAPPRPRKARKTTAADNSISAGPSTGGDAFGSTSCSGVTREIRPMPVRSRMKGRPRPASPPPMFGGSSKRPRLATEQ